jgi:hypothetical protein
MGYADRDDDRRDHDPGIEGTRIFSAMRQAPGPGADQFAGYEWHEASSPGRYERPSGSPAGPPASQAGVIRPGQGPAGRERLRRMRPDRWVIAVGSITGAVAVYVALTTAGVPARPMPSPFAPAATQAPAHPASKTPVTCVTSGP